MFPPTRSHACLLIPALAAIAFLPPGTTVQGVAAPEDGKGKKYALLVGVRKYDSDKFEDLRFTENDVEELARVLRERAGFTSVRLLTTTRGAGRKADAPTAANVRAALEALLARKTKEDTILVALSGHGIQSKVKGRDKDESFFCPSDAQLNDTRTLVSLGSLVTDLDDCGARVKLLLVDACRNDPKAGRNVDVETLPRLPRGTAALFSCSSGERAFETDRLGKGHGVFFHFVIDGLRGEARNRSGEVTWGSLAEHVTRGVSRAVPRLIGEGARQTPELKVNLRGESPVLVLPAEAVRQEDGNTPGKEKLRKEGDKASATPATVADLKVMQAQVQAALKKALPATVGIRVGGTTGSGVIVSADGYVLVSGQVSGEPNRRCTIILADGREVRGKTLGANAVVDSGLIQITDKGKWDFVEMGDSARLRPGQWCIALGHPGGVKKGRTPVVRLGRVLHSARALIQTDCTLVGGDFGGPLFDLDGKVIGIHSRIGPAITANFHVPVNTYRETWDRLAKGERWTEETAR
jgi:hypothetical protein